MREVVSAMKVSTNLERVADQSVTIARRAKHLNNRPAVRELALLEPAYRLAVAIFVIACELLVANRCSQTVTRLMLIVKVGEGGWRRGTDALPFRSNPDVCPAA